METWQRQTWDWLADQQRTQAYLAREMGISATYFHLILHGRKPMTTRLFAILSSRLGRPYGGIELVEPASWMPAHVP